MTACGRNKQPQTTGSIAPAGLWQRIPLWLAALVLHGGAVFVLPKPVVSPVLLTALWITHAAFPDTETLRGDATGDEWRAAPLLRHPARPSCYSLPLGASAQGSDAHTSAPESCRVLPSLMSYLPYPAKCPLPLPGRPGCRDIPQGKRLGPCSCPTAGEW